MGAHCPDEFRALVLSKIGRLTPKMTSALVDEVAAEWGYGMRSDAERDLRALRRRVERALSALLADGEVKRDADGWLLVWKRKADKLPTATAGRLKEAV